MSLNTGPAAAGFMDLSTELKILIMRLLSRQDLYQARLINHDLNHIVSPLLFRTVSLWPPRNDPESSASEAFFWILRNIARHIRRLRLHGALDHFKGVLNPDSQALCETEILNVLPGSILTDCDLGSLCDMVHRAPSRLHALKVLEVLFGSQNSIQNLMARTTFRQDGERNASKIIGLASKMCSLKGVALVKPSDPHLDESQADLDMWASVLDKLPHLEYVHLYSASTPFLDKMQHNLRSPLTLVTLKFHGVHFPANFSEIFVSSFNPTHLRNLALVKCSNSMRLLDLLPEIRVTLTSFVFQKPSFQMSAQLAADPPTIIEKLERALSSFAGLESLCLQYPSPHCMPAMHPIIHHHRTLKHLSILCQNSQNGSIPYYNLNELRTLTSQCLSLETLALSLPNYTVRRAADVPATSIGFICTDEMTISTTSEYDHILTSIASLPNLLTLRVISHPVIELSTPSGVYPPSRLPHKETHIVLNALAHLLIHALKSQSSPIRGLALGHRAAETSFVNIVRPNRGALRRYRRIRSWPQSFFEVEIVGGTERAAPEMQGQDWSFRKLEERSGNKPCSRWMWEGGLEKLDSHFDFLDLEEEGGDRRD